MSSTNERRKELGKERRIRDNNLMLDFWNNLSQIERSGWVRASIEAKGHQNSISSMTTNFGWNLSDAMRMAYDANNLFVDPDTGKFVVRVR